MLFDGLFFRPFQLPLQRVQILGELRLVQGQRRIEEPERPTKKVPPWYAVLREARMESSAERKRKVLWDAEQEKYYFAP